MDHPRTKTKFFSEVGPARDLDYSGWGGNQVRPLGREPIQLVDFDDIFALDLSRWRAIVMAKSLFWLSDEAWKPKPTPAARQAG
jgi:hypothetical protein